MVGPTTDASHSGEALASGSMRTTLRAIASPTTWLPASAARACG